MDMLELARLRQMVEDSPRDELPAIAGELARVSALVTLRLAEPVQNGTAPPTKHATEPERLLSTEQAADVLGVDIRWLYRRADSLPFTRRLSPRTLRFSEPGIRRWLESRR